MKTAITLAAVLWASVAFSETSAQHDIESRDSGETYIYISGVISGLEYEDAQLILLKKQPFFCPPKFPITAPKALDIMSSYINDGHRAMASLPSAVVLLAALEEAFPCQK